MKDQNCIFCKIADGSIPANTIYEDDDFRVILDNGPATRGHALVIPKEHYGNLFEMPGDLLAKAVKVAATRGESLIKKLGASGMNLVQNNGETAGQTVMHFHMHLIPRYAGDNARILWEPTSPSAEELKELCDEINS